MADESEIHPMNASGKFFNDLSCIDCGLCPELAPSIFQRDDEGGYSYVFNQPKSDSELKVATQAMSDCPTESIGERN